jgi:uncharacterized protein DUF6665
MSSRIPPEGSGRPRSENGASALERAVRSEQANNLGRLGRAVVAALARLRAASDAEREAAEYACAEAVWLYFVQREACGLVRHDPVIEAYQIPASVLAKVGAQPPHSPGV